MISNNTKQEIVELALKCFSQFGFSKTNMTIISEYTGYSRVTVHKYFKNKNILFRSVVQLCTKNSISTAENRMQDIQLTNPWDLIEEYLMTIGKKVFENVQDDYVLKDLHSAVHDLAKDIVDAKQTVTIKFIQNELEQGVKQNLLDLESVNTTAEELAYLIDYSYYGIMRNASLQDIPNHVHHLIKVYRVATQVA
jgi:AcrR family transcriptional regulator